MMKLKPRKEKRMDKTTLKLAIETIKNATEGEIDKVLDSMEFNKEVLPLEKNIRYMLEYITEVNVTHNNISIPPVDEIMKDYITFVLNKIAKGVNDAVSELDIDIDNFEEILENYAGENYQEVVDYFNRRKKEWMDYDEKNVGWNFIGYEDELPVYQCSKCGTSCTGEDIEYVKPLQCPVCGSAMINGDRWS